MTNNMEGQVRQLDLNALNPPLRIAVVRDEHGLTQVKDFLERTETFGLDLETNKVDDFTKRKIRTITVGNRQEQYVIDLLAFAGSREALEEQGDRITPVWARQLIEVLRPFLESDKRLKVGHNLTFEYRTLSWCLGLTPYHFWDTQEVEKVTYCGKVSFFAKDFWGLDDLTARYCGVQMDKTLQTSFDLESELTEDQVKYAAFDVRIVCSIQGAQKTKVVADGLEKVVQIENDAIPAFGDMYLNGIYLDSAAWLGIVESTKVRHATNVQRLDTLFVPFVGSKHIPPVSQQEIQQLEQAWRETNAPTWSQAMAATGGDPCRAEEYVNKCKELRAERRKAYQAAAKSYREWEKFGKDCEGDALINYGSNPQLLAAFRKMGFGPAKLPNTNDRTLSLLKDEPAIAALQAYRETQKALTTYGENFLQHINKHTGRVHSNINQLGAETGRTSSSNPNVANIPRGSDYRGAFRAREGYSFISVDMNGAELRILAELSGETVMIEAFAKNHDVHSVGAEIIFGDQWKLGADADCAYYKNSGRQKCKCKAHKKLRDYIKSINFGICYGMEAKKLADKLGISKKEAQALLDKWRVTFKRAWAYLVNSGNQAKMKFCARTMSGRVRYFSQPDWGKCKEIAIQRAIEDGKDPHKINLTDATSKVYYGQFGSIEREGKNTPVQGLNADIMKLSMSLLWRRIRQYDAYIVNSVYDELDLEVRHGQEDYVAALVGECYKEAAAQFMKKVVMLSEAQIGDRWQK